MLAKTRILIADDDLDSLSKLYLRLLHKQLKVEATNNAEEILQRVIRFKPHILLLSASLIGENALLLVKRLKTEYHVHPIMMIEENDKAFYDVDLLIKPINFEILLEILDMYR